jgi:CheY-like chemotaxis protein
METRGFQVETAESVAEGVAKSKSNPPKYAVVDLRLGDGNGLDVIEAIRQKRDDTRIIVLTGYGNIATAVTAVKLGRRRLSGQARRRRRRIRGADAARRREGGAAREPDVGRPRALGAYPARL